MHEKVSVRLRFITHKSSKPRYNHNERESHYQKIIIIIMPYKNKLTSFPKISHKFPKKTDFVD